MPAPIHQINGSTFRVPLGDDYVDIGNLDAAKFEPHICLYRWNKERSIKVMPHGIMAGEVEIEIEPDKIKSKYKFEIGGEEEEIETEFYVMPPTAQFEGGVAELDIILPRKPKDNKIILDIEAEGLNFFKQLPLTPQEIADGAIRPDNIVNSYVVKDKVKLWHAIGRTNYMTGKLFHIPRPRPIDAIGNWVWADLEIVGGQQIITIPWSFLNSAVYPIRHCGGDTFGKTAIGLSESPVNANQLKGIKATPGSAGTGNSIKVYCKNNFDDFKGVIVEDTGKTIIANGVTNSDVIGSAWDWQIAIFGTSPDLTVQTYWIALVPNAGVQVKWDSESAGDAFYDNSNSYASPSDPTDGIYNNAIVRSIYCDFTPSASAGGGDGGGVAAAMLLGA